MTTTAFAQPSHGCPETSFLSSQVLFASNDGQALSSEREECTFMASKFDDDGQRRIEWIGVFETVFNNTSLMALI